MPTVLARLLVALALVAAAWHATAAAATWTIVAADPATGEVGVAGASCESRSLLEIAALAPGRGAAAAQGDYSEQTRDRIWQLLQQGKSPADILATVTGPASDSDSSGRQYGIVTTDAAGGFTGNRVPPWGGAFQQEGSAGVVSVQGGDLADEAVARRALEAFHTPDMGTLALPDRLMLALEAGSAAGGDRRCNADDITQTARSTFLLVARGSDPPFAAPGGHTPEHVAGLPWLALSVVNAENRENPLIELREQYDVWRSANLAVCEDCDLSAIPVPEGDRAAEPPLDSNALLGLLVVGGAVLVIVAVVTALTITIVRRRRRASSDEASEASSGGSDESSGGDGSPSSPPMAEADAGPA